MSVFAIIAARLRVKLIESHAVSSLDRTIQTWLERARATAPKRAIKRGSSDLPTLENLDAYGDFFRGLLVEDASMGCRKLREAIKTKGFLVAKTTIERWLDREHGKAKRALLAAPIDGLPSVDRQGLVHYHAELFEEWNSKPAITYMQLKESRAAARCHLQQTLYAIVHAIAIFIHGQRLYRCPPWRRLYNLFKVSL